MQSNESLGVLRLIFPSSRAGRPRPVIGWKHLGGPWPLSDYYRELSSGCITDWKGSDTTWELRMSSTLLLWAWSHDLVYLFRDWYFVILQSGSAKSCSVPRLWWPLFCLVSVLRGNLGPCYELFLKKNKSTFLISPHFRNFHPNFIIQIWEPCWPSNILEERWSWILPSVQSSTLL